MSASRKGSHEGFTLVELIVVVAVLGILVAIVVPALVSAVDRTRQRRSMADMVSLAKANGMHQVDSSRYVNALGALSPTYMVSVPASDGWGTPWQYIPAGDQRSYELRSLGKDGALGPAAPVVWLNDPFEPDLIMNTGQFTQMPTSR